jgi:hypothetical protein
MEKIFAAASFSYGSVPASIVRTVLWNWYLGRIGALGSEAGALLNQTARRTVRGRRKAPFEGVGRVIENVGRRFREPQ